MSKQSSDNPSKSNQLLKALTQLEIARLIDALLGALSSELEEQAISQLPADTQQTVRQILAPSPPQVATKSTVLETVSLAKQAEVWAGLWQEWDTIVCEASEEEGKYIVREADWEEPYFDPTTFIEDLESVANKMQPLIQTAFEHKFSPDPDFITALLDAETDVASGIPDWMEITDGLYLEQHLTRCVLEGEWLNSQEQGQDAFDFMGCIREYEQQFQEVQLNSDTVFEFLIQLPEPDRQVILAGLTANKETALWKSVLANIHSCWQQFYLHLIEQYAPDCYLKQLRTTIPQQWQNGLPIIEELLNEQNYPESLVAIEETINSLLKPNRSDVSWTPETSLLVAIPGLYYDSNSENINTLLRYYQQTAQGLNQTERANALEIQQIGIDRWFNWSRMFAAFVEVPLSEVTRQALFISWRDYVVRRSKPYGWNGYRIVPTVDSWWLCWLIESVDDRQKGVSWFQAQITQWLDNLPSDRTQLGENYDRLRLLTKDLTEIYYQGESGYPQFDLVVIRPQEFSTPSDESRREYLKTSAPDNLFDLVMNYWKVHLHQFVPKPESVQNANYTNHARWMVALKELSPPDYETLLAQWKVVHKRRINLWKAMKQMGVS
jgi:hypothetical protein